MKYEKPMLFNINGFDFTEGGCQSGDSAGGSCGTGTIADPGTCGIGISASPNCHGGNIAVGTCAIGESATVKCSVGNNGAL